LPNPERESVAAVPAFPDEAIVFDLQFEAGGSGLLALVRAVRARQIILADLQPVMAEALLVQRFLNAVVHRSIIVVLNDRQAVIAQRWRPSLAFVAVDLLEAPHRPAHVPVGRRRGFVDCPSPEISERRLRIETRIVCC
jgi:hypothetical protein